MNWQILGLTLRTAALATLLILPPGLAVAWLLARYRWRGSRSSRRSSRCRW